MRVCANVSNIVLLSLLSAEESAKHTEVNATLCFTTLQPEHKTAACASRGLQWMETAACAKDFSL